MLAAKDEQSTISRDEKVRQNADLQECQVLSTRTGKVVKALEYSVTKPDG